MSKSNLKMVGNFGCYLDDDNVISFQIGDRPMASVLEPDPMFPLSEEVFRIRSAEHPGIPGVQPWLQQHEMRGNRVRHKEEPASARLITKQVNMLYGHGLAVYKPAIVDGKLLKQWVDCPEIMDWLNSWEQRGLESGYKEVAKSIIKNYYYFRDCFVKWRFTKGKARGTMPVAGLESMENKHCRLATTKKDVATDVVYYRDFRYIAVGRWGYGTSTFRIYPKFSFSELANYRFAAISHHRENPWMSSTV